MENLTHYIFVRRDLPIGVIAAMVTHAAGESGALYQDEYDGRFRGATAVVLEAKNEDSLYAAERRLRASGWNPVAIVESHGVYAGQLMALGLIPMPRVVKGHWIWDCQLLKSCLDNPKSESILTDTYDKNSQDDTLPSARVCAEGSVGRDRIVL